MQLSLPARRTLAGLVALPALVAAPLVVPTAAQAMPREWVCVSWYQVGWTTTDEKGDETYVIEARCNGWMGFGDGESTDQPPKGWADGGGTVSPSDKEYCDSVKEQLEEMRGLIDEAQQHIAQAQADLAGYAGQASSDYADVTRYRAELDQAKAEYADAEAYYVARNETTVEREVKAGVTITRQVGVNPWEDGGPEVLRANDDLNTAQHNFDRVWDKWSRHSSPAFQDAQRTVDAFQDILRNGPILLEQLQRELSENCA